MSESIFKNKTIIVTGASDGIGAELARQLAAFKPKLVLAARRPEALNEVAKACEAQGAQCLVVPTDVSIEADCRALIERAVAQFGAIDALVNNAGVSMQARFAEIENTDVYEKLMRINLMGSIWPTHAALPHLKKSKGHIVAVSSLAGLVGVPERTTYCATKFAQTGFFEALRVEIAPDGVDVCLVYPGVVLTNIRVHGWNAKGERLGSSGLDEADAMTVEACARLIVEAMTNRKREVVMTTKGKLGRWLKLIAPGVVDKLARKALKQK
ncbi:MAG: SDR family oxidoreductase [Burkholderiales bacterium]|nr:MAG: SDR family oxidoreductase [Burkholderiales bacterium]TAG81396.1 MAG: SDR family oxidoreductase [Betaproteobacteria bacterium]